MRTDSYNYEVYIERQKVETIFDAKYHWWVDVYRKTEIDNGDGTKTVEEWKKVSDLRRGGMSYRLPSAKKKAIKHIMSVEKEVNSGVTFGVMFTTGRGTAGNVLAKLKK